jgi:hypothetical protein
MPLKICSKKRAGRGENLNHHVDEKYACISFFLVVAKKTIRGEFDGTP